MLRTLCTIFIKTNSINDRECCQVRSLYCLLLYIYRIAVDPLFPPPPWPNAKKHMIPECIESNRFELIFNELTDGAELKALPIDDIALNGIIEEEEMEDEGSDNDDGDDYAH